MSLFKRIDIFGKRVNLRFQGDDYYKTRCGAVATIVMFLVLIGIFTLSALDIMKGKILSLNYLQTHDNGFEHTDLEDSKLYMRVDHVMEYQIFGFALEDDLDESYISFETYATKNRKTRKDKLLLKPYNCTDDVYNNLSKTVGKDLPPDLKIQCVKIPTSKFNEGYDPIFRLMECMHDKKCKPTQERNLKLKEVWIWVFTLTDETDYTSSSKNVFETSFQARSMPVSNTLKKNSHLNLQKLEIITVSGLTVPKKYKTISYRIKSWTENLVSIDAMDPIIANLLLRNDDIDKIIITKKFQTLLNVLAFIGGISKGITMILLIFVFPVREVLYYRKLMNHMFRVCCDSTQIDIALAMNSKDDDEEEEEEALVDEEIGKGEFKGRKKERRKTNTNTKKRKRKSKNTKNMKKKLNVFKSMIKKDNKKATGLMEAISNGLLTKEKMLDNMKEAFNLGNDDEEPKQFTFSDMMKAGFGKKKSLRKKRLSEIFRNGDVNATLLPLDDEEIEAVSQPVHIKNGMQAWKTKAERRIIRKKQKLLLGDSSDSDSSDDDIKGSVLLATDQKPKQNKDTESNFSLTLAIFNNIQAILSTIMME